MEFSEQVVITALKNMFQGSHFSICTIDKCLKIANSIPSASDYECLSALHCIDWKNMTPELREEIFNRTLSMFQQSGFNLSVLDMGFNDKKQQFEIKQPKKRVLAFLGTKEK